jgi:hypothetical protein
MTISLVHTELVPCPRCESSPTRYPYCSLCNLDRVVPAEVDVAYRLAIIERGEEIRGEEAEKLRLTLTLTGLRCSTPSNRLPKPLPTEDD